MKIIASLPVLFFLFSCGTSRQAAGDNYTREYADTVITQSLFSDRNATISEENIQKLLDASYRLPGSLRVAMVRIDNNNNSSRRYNYFSNDEDYLKTQQSYLDSFTNRIRQSGRVKKVSVIPEIVVSKNPGFTQLREAAVRLQADVVVVYSISSDIYSRYKMFSGPDLKAFATTQLILLDVRTGMVPFSTIVTKDQFSRKMKSELDNTQAANRVQHEAVLLSIDETGRQLLDFLKQD